MAAPESTRARRFALPDLEDERADQSIEAFVHGRSRRARGSRSAAAPHPGDAVALRQMPGRLAFEAALAAEMARAARYDRPAAVAIVELRTVRASAATESWLRVHAGLVGRILLRDSRATDLVARVGTARFHVLLPETGAAAAAEFVDRIVGECRDRLQAAGVPLTVVAGYAASSPAVSLREAVARALRSIETAA